MKLGLHVSIAGGIDRAVDNATVLGCTAFQMFTRNPRGWESPRLVNKEVDSFKKKLLASNIDRYAVCAKFEPPMFALTNLSSLDKALHKKSVSLLINEVERCGILGLSYLVINAGSHLGAGKDVGIKNLVNACNTATKEVSNDVTILLQNSPGTKNSLGSRFEELGEILEQLKPRKRFGVCLDTCHALAAGYDLRNMDAVDDTIAAFDKHIGMRELHIVHLNDSKGDINCNLDRHEHIGMGCIGEEGFRALLMNEEIRARPLILETPIDYRRDDANNIKKVRELAS